MYTLIQRAYRAAFAAVLLCACLTSFAQSAGSSGTISGTVKDPTGAVVTNAKVTIENPVSGYTRETTTDSVGQFRFTNVPLNPYHLTASAPGFSPTAQDVDVRSLVPVTITARLNPADVATTVNVEGNDLIESDSVPSGYFLPLIVKGETIAVMQLTKYAGATFETQQAYFLMPWRRNFRSLLRMPWNMALWQSVSRREVRPFHPEKWCLRRPVQNVRCGAGALP